jgi:hypothetical protein
MPPRPFRLVFRCRNHQWSGYLGGFADETGTAEWWTPSLCTQPKFWAIGLHSNPRYPKTERQSFRGLVNRGAVGFNSTPSLRLGGHRRRRWAADASPPPKTKPGRSADLRKTLDLWAKEDAIRATVTAARAPADVSHAPRPQDEWCWPPLTSTSARTSRPPTAGVTRPPRAAGLFVPARTATPSPPAAGRSARQPRRKPRTTLLAQRPPRPLQRRSWRSHGPPRRPAVLAKTSRPVPWS